MSERDDGQANASLRDTATRGFVWTGGQALFTRLLSLLGFVVLARLLGPHDYGVVTLANVFVVLLSLMAAAGYSQALVQRQQVDREDLDTVFWIGMGTSVVLALVLVAAAWPLSSVFDEPKLRPVLQVLSVTFVFVALGSTHQAVLQRALRFRAIATANMVSALIATVLGVAFAVAGFGVWALVVQTVAGVALTSLGVMARSGYRPSPYVSMARFWPLFEFSRNYLGNSLLTFLNQRTDDFLIGSALGTGALGVYTIAYRILTVMSEVLGTSVRRVAFPVFAQLQGDRERLLRAYTSAMRVCAVVAVPAFLFCLAAAPEIVHVVFGTKWDRSIPVMRILCLFGALEALMQFNGALLQGVGRAKLVFRIALAGTVLQVVGFVIAVNYGIEWVAASYVIRAYLIAPVGLVAAARALHSTVRATLVGLRGPIACTALMVGAVLAARAIMPAGVPEGVRLFVLIAVGAVVYVAALRVLDRSTFDEFTGQLRGVAGKRAASRPPAAYPEPAPNAQEPQPEPHP